MNLAGQKGAHPGGVLVRVIEYRVDGGEVIRLLTDLFDHDTYPARELAVLYHERWGATRSRTSLSELPEGGRQLMSAA
jgi:hypothetical protein